MSNLRFNFGNHQKSHDQQAGFTLIEVLAGMLMATIFVLITTQAIAISALYRVRAQRETEAWNWIQEDFEDIKFASLQDIANADCSATVNTNGYAQSLITKVDATTTSPSIKTQADLNIPNLVNKEYNAVRTLDVYNSAPFNVMTVSYSVIEPTSSQEIANFYTEIIPDEAFQCD